MVFLMKNKQWISLLLVIVMLASMLVACNGGGVNPNVATTADPAASAASSSYFASLSESMSNALTSNSSSDSQSGNSDGSSDSSSDSSSSDPGQLDATNLVINTGYQIVISSAKQSAMETVLSTLQNALSGVVGGELSVVYPKYNQPLNTATEIVIGDVVLYSKDTRPGAKRVGDYENFGDWEIYVNEGRVFINGGSDMAVEDAVKYFVTTYVTGQTAVKVPKTLSYQGKLSPSDITVSQMSNKFYLNGATMSTNGIVLTAVKDTVIFKLNAGGDVKLKFTSEGVGTFRVYTGRGADYKTINVTSGTSEVTLAEGLTGDITEFMIVKRTGATACTLTAINAAGELADPPSVLDTPTTTTGKATLHSLRSSVAATIQAMVLPAITAAPALISIFSL